MAAKVTARRNYGTGTLRVVGRSWVASWYAADGRRVCRKVGPARTPGEKDGLTKAQAEQAFRKMRETESARRSIGTVRVTMEEAGADLRRRLEIKNRKKSHRMTVEADLRNHITPFFGTRELHTITPDDIERYIVIKQRDGLAIKTVRNHVNTMHSVFDIGVRRGWCPSNPVKLADRPVLKKTETRLRFLDQPALDQLLGTTYSDDAFGRIEPTLYRTAAMTGLRQGELLGLRWRDVDFTARKVRVVSPYVRGEFADPKSVGSGRSVPMATKVADALRELHAVTPFPRDKDLVFAHPETGNPLDRSKLTRRFAQAIARADVNRVTFHELRHTFGTRMAAAGVPMRTIQEWMGHADMKTTQVYSHYSPTKHETETIDSAFA